MFRPIRNLAIAVAGLLVSAMALATINPFSDDFESYDPADEETLFSSGWIVYGNVFDGTNYLYGYGPDPAPNVAGEGAAFSGVAVGQGSVAQGAQQFNTFSDYNNADHNLGRLIEANVYREQPITAENVGQTWTFRFDAKLGNLTGATTALAFIKTIDPGAGFATTNFVTQDTTSTPVTWNTYELSLTIDAGLVGQLIQTGFSNTATNYEGSGVYYDNVAFLNAADPDSDGIDSDTDNCTNVANADQIDADGDGHGNLCDGDFNQTCFVNFDDLNLMKTGFFQTDPVLDLDSSGRVNFDDLSIMKGLFFRGPGPSAPDAQCN